MERDKNFMNLEVKNKIVEPELNIVLRTDDDQENDLRPVFIVGNFNNWETKDYAFQMEKVGKGIYHFKFPYDFKFPEELVYKFTRGDWSEVEIDKYGNRTNNRICKKHNGVKKEHVSKWRQNWLPFREKYLPKVQLISEEFEIPQLNKTRKIWALLPHNYSESAENYPVLYLHDAQNLFNENAAYGNWEIDKKLAVMTEYNIGNIIIIAIEHGEKERIEEYNVGNTVLGNGQGKKYIRFITDTLKPFIDSKYRTLPEREHTGIGGSSMGGLVSIFSGIMYPEVYGKLMIFSPSLWVVPKINLSFLDLEEHQNTRVYLYAGEDESETMVKRITKFKNRLIKKGDGTNKIVLKLSINPEGKHNEVYWSSEFPKAIEWLFFNTNES